MALPAEEPVLSLPSSGEVRVSIVDPGILSIGFSGRVDGAVARQAVVEVRQALGGRRARVILCNTLDIIEVEMSSRAAGRELLEVAKEHGVTASYCAVASTAVRMIGVALALTVGLRVHFFATMEAARAAASDLSSLRR